MVLLSSDEIEVGSDRFFFAYLDAWKFVFKGHNILKEGYSKYKGNAYKVPTLASSSRWFIVVSGERMIEDMRKAPSDVLSFREVVIDDDLISWLVEGAPLEHRNVEDITAKVMLINFAAIHTTAITTTNVLFNLAARQEYIAPLRSEIEKVTRAHGWTKDAMGRLQKLDSFMKESSRLSGIVGLSMSRKAKKDFTFSNGLTIPAGYTVAVASEGIHTDPAIYEDPLTFQGFRFYEGKETTTDYDDSDPLRKRMVTLDPTFLLFGHGRNACPGRFFAVNEVKALLAHIILDGLGTTFRCSLRSRLAHAALASETTTHATTSTASESPSSWSTKPSSASTEASSPTLEELGLFIEFASAITTASSTSATAGLKDFGLFIEFASAIATASTASPTASTAGLENFGLFIKFASAGATASTTSTTAALEDFGLFLQFAGIVSAVWSATTLKNFSFFADLARIVSAIWSTTTLKGFSFFADLAGSVSAASYYSNKAALEGFSLFIKFASAIATASTASSTSSTAGLQNFGLFIEFASAIATASTTSTTATLEDLGLFIELTSFLPTGGTTPSATTAEARSASTSASASATLNKVDVSFGQVARARAGHAHGARARFTGFEGGSTIVHLVNV
ncbi:hypothetical protein MD484_g6916, partial [Candolleomyces efflorescens]